MQCSFIMVLGRHFEVTLELIVINDVTLFTCHIGTYIYSVILWLSDTKKIIKGVLNHPLG